MNERIKELAREAGFYANPDIEKFEKFAELIVRECIEQIYPDWLKEGETRTETPLGFAVKRVKEHFGVEE